MAKWDFLPSGARVFGPGLVLYHSVRDRLAGAPPLLAVPYAPTSLDSYVLDRSVRAGIEVV